jgi:hypothetical protein
MVSGNLAPLKGMISLPKLGGKKVRKNKNIKKRTTWGVP